MTEPNGNWEKDLVTKLASAALREQRRARLWGIFFKLLTFAYVTFILLTVYDWRGRSDMSGGKKHTALVELNGLIAPGNDGSAEKINAEWALQRTVEHIKQVKGVGTQIALTYVLTIEDPYRFPKSRQVGCFLGLRPGRRNSGESEPQKGISKEGDRYLRTMMVQGAHYILGPFGEDSDLRRWGQKLAERGGKNAKKRAVVAVARKLAVLLHRLWVGGEVYEPLRNSQKAMREVA